MKKSFNFYNILSLLTAVFECICFGGIYTGWPAAQYMFENEGYFNQSCVNNSKQLTNEIATHRCNEQDQLLSLVLIIPITCMYISTYFFGYAYDRWGTRTIRCLGTVLLNIGCLLISETSSSESWVLFPGIICYNIGGYAITFMCNAQLGNLFGTWKSSVITLMIGCVQASSLSTAVMKIIYDTGVNTTTIFRYFNILTIVIWLRTFLFLPKMHIPCPLPKTGYKCGLQHLIEWFSWKIKAQSGSVKVIGGYNTATPTTERILSIAEVNKGSYVSDECNGDRSLDETPGFSHVVKAPLFWAEVLYMVSLHVRNIFFTSSLLPWLDHAFHLDDETLGGMVNTFTIVQSGVLLTAPLNGLVIDILKRNYRQSGSSQKNASAKAVYASKTFTSILAFTFSLFACLNYFHLQYGTIFLFLIIRSFTYGGFFSFIALLYPKKHFGKLTGLGQVFYGLTQLLQYPLLELVFGPLNGNFLPLNIAFCVLSISTLAHPLYNFFKITKAENKKQSIQQSTVENHTASYLKVNAKV